MLSSLPSPGFGDTQIQNGNVFGSNNFDVALADSAFIESLFIPGESIVHLFISVSLVDTGIFQIFEAPTTTDDGAAIAILNLNLSLACY